MQETPEEKFERDMAIAALKADDIPIIDICTKRERDTKPHTDWIPRPWEDCP